MKSCCETRQECEISKTLQNHYLLSCTVTNKVGKRISHNIIIFLRGDTDNLCDNFIS